jgi:prophage regulatory protein
MAHPLSQPTTTDPVQGDRVYRRLLKRTQVLDRTSLSNTVMYQLIAEGRFPPPVKPTGGRASAWVEEEIDQYIASCIAARDSAHATT